VIQVHAPRSFRSTLAAFAALAAVVLLPALHGLHAPHPSTHAGLHAAGLPAVTASAHLDVEGQACPLCALASQARTSTPAQRIAFEPRTEQLDATLPIDHEPRSALAILDPVAPPRAPPA